MNNENNLEIYDKKQEEVLNVNKIATELNQNYRINKLDEIVKLNHIAEQNTIDKNKILENYKHNFNGLLQNQTSNFNNK